MLMFTVHCKILEGDREIKNFIGRLNNNSWEKKEETLN